MQRRDFLAGALQAGIWLPLASSGAFARPLRSMLLSGAASNPDRVLVLINLNGGNDGLNTLVPYNDPVYYNSRPTLAVRRESLLTISPNLGFHPAMVGVHALFNDGRCAVVQSVGYPDQDRSHFRSTDIWHTASTSGQTGWTGRSIELLHPEYPATIPPAPYAIQVSSSTTLLLQGARGSSGMSMDNADQFYEMTGSSGISSEPLPQTLAGAHLGYIRQIQAESDIYSKTITRAIENSTTRASYAADSLSTQLRAVARMINGGLATGIYVVTLAGFDTHYGQRDLHVRLLTALSQAVSSFMEDITAAGNADRVVCMTYSEFGRRVHENGSIGTDHGAAAPQFVFGKPVAGRQVLGGTPDLANLDNRGDVRFEIDFRRLYSTLLQDWLGFDAQNTAALLGGTFATLPLFGDPLPLEVERGAETLGGFASLDRCSPDPASVSSEVTFTTTRSGDVRLAVYAVNGERVALSVDDRLEAGVHRVRLDVRGLPNGEYTCVLDGGGERHSQLLEVVH